MRLLILNGLFPLKNNPYSGIFVLKRLQYLNKINSLDVFTVNIVKTESFSLRIIRKILNAPIMYNVAYKGIKHIGDVMMNYIHIKMGVCDIINIKAWCKEAAEVVLRELKKQKFHPDVIHAHWIIPNGLIAKFISYKYGIPYIVTIHGSDLCSKYNRFFYRDLILEILKDAFRNIFVSDALLKFANSIGYIYKNNVIIPNGVDLNIFKPMDKESVRKKIGIHKEGYKYVGFVGNLIPIKGADELPYIFYEIKKRYSRVFFIIVGDGFLYKRLKNKMTKLNLEVMFTGRVNPEKVALYINAMDVLVVPSKREGFGIVALEAQACKVPVVGSNVGGLPEAIGENGLIVERNRKFKSNFAEAVVKLLNSNFTVSYERVLKFDWFNIVNTEFNLYRSSLNSLTL